MSSLERSSFKQLSALIFLGTSGIVTLFLFYIDEGNYSLDNLFTTGNMISLSIYFIGIYICQLIAFQLFRRYQSIGRSIFLAFFAGLPIGIAVMVCFFILLRIVVQA
ncbi:MAG: hypothetical protein ACPGEG_01210 [Salibacteraceae bacterium]